MFWVGPNFYLINFSNTLQQGVYGKRGGEEWIHMKLKMSQNGSKVKMSKLNSSNSSKKRGVRRTESARANARCSATQKARQEAE
jgi:hypothetical protein